MATFGDLTQEALLAISTRLDGKSLANFQALNSDTKRASSSDSIWKSLYEREFPDHYRQLGQCQSEPRSWHEAYSSRRRAEKCWASGAPSAPSAMVRNPGRTTLGIAFLKDPFPNNLILAGHSIDEPQVGELTVFDKETAINNAAAAAQIVKLRGGAVDTPSLPVGAFFIDQRPKTDELIVTTLNAPVFGVRLHYTRKEAQEDESMDVDMEDANASGDLIASNYTWELEHLYELSGHSAGCPTVRTKGDKAITASFDDTMRLFTLPPVGTSPTPGAPLPKLEAVHVYTDDPAHAPQPPETEQNRGILGLAVSDDISKLVSGSNDMQIKVWDVATGRITLRLQSSQGWLWWVEGLDGNLNQVISAGTDGCVREWDLRAGQQTSVFNLSSQHGGTVFPVAGVVPTEDNNYFVAGSFDHALYIIDRRANRVLNCLGGHQERLARVVLQGDTVLSSCFDGTVGVWDYGR